MGKLRRKSRNESEHFRGQIRELESENRQLKRRLKELDKRSHFYQEAIEDIIDPIDIEEKCKACKTGSLKLLDLVYVTYLTCSNCDNRIKK